MMGIVVLGIQLLILNLGLIITISISLVIVIVLIKVLYRRNKSMKFQKLFHESFHDLSFTKYKVRVIVKSDNNGYKLYHDYNLDLYYSEHLILLDSELRYRRWYDLYFPLIILKEGSRYPIPMNFTKMSFIPISSQLSSLDSVIFKLLLNKKYLNIGLSSSQIIVQIDFKDKNQKKNLEISDNWLVFH